MGCPSSFGMTNLSPQIPGQPLVTISDRKTNDGYDNEEGDLILYENSIIVDSDGHSYQVNQKIGEGSSSNVYKVTAFDEINNFIGIFALKISKSDQDSYSIRKWESNVLNFLTNVCLHIDHNHLFHYEKSFIYHNHLCILTELLYKSTYDILMECNDNHGLSLSLIQNVLRCTLQTLVIFESLRIAHCDIKPENIMQVSQNSNDFKLIDYGLCSSVDNPLVTCIQSLFYRSPEVLFDLGFTWKADIWSLGCVAAELFFGIPLFPSESKTHLIYLIDITLGHYPLNFVQKISGPIRNRYFLKSGELKPIKTLRNENDEEFDDGNPFFYKDMEMNILTYNCTGAKQISEDEIENRKLLADLLKMMLKIDPDERCNAESALKHPFFERNLS